MNNNLSQTLLEAGGNWKSNMELESVESVESESGEKLSVNLTGLAQCIIHDMEKCELDLIVNNSNLSEAAILPDYVFIIITVIYSIIFVCGIVGNTLVIYVVSRYY